ncbi:DegV family protein [Arthrobacter sp. GMC3]|uniref:DegV family protein n=1 Tax=Arthrobacter sp. GMC3 TaxID=2058894 RepID=UPI000CE417B3|nr:DegV family protein [Arthrobacter sp. GMC3]
MAADVVSARDWLRHQVHRLRPRPTPAELQEPARPRIAIVTDSAAALPPEWVDAHSGSGQLSIVAMPVIIGEDVFSDDDAELETHISLALASGTAVRTSRPSPGQFEKAYRAAAEAGFDAVVSIHISSKLSGTLDAAKLAAGRAELPVLILDSGTVGMAQGVAVQAAIGAIEAGEGAEAVLSAAQTAAAATTVFFYVPSLEQLRRGGRISLASSWVGTVLDIKPLLGIRDGSVVPLEKVRTAVKAIARLETLSVAEIASREPGTARVSLHHFGNEQQARTLNDSLHARCPGLGDGDMTRLPAVLAAHAGLGALVVVVSERFVPPQPVQGP